MSTPILKTLRADPSTTVDLSAHKPENLSDEATAVWEHFIQDTPLVVERS